MILGFFRLWIRFSLAGVALRGEYTEIHYEVAGMCVYDGEKIFDVLARGWRYGAANIAA